MKKTLTVLVTVFLAACLFVSCDNEDPFFHTVRFDSNGGSGVAEQIVADGEKAERPDDPTYGENVFMGWQLNGEAYTFDTPVTSNITLKAVWTKYVVSFDSDGGSAVDYECVLEGGKAREPADPTKSGSTFIGWYNGGTAFDFNTVITSDMCLLAVWQENTASVYYKVSFDVDGVKAYADQSVRENETASNPGTPAKDGYSFAGWYNGDVKYDFSSKVTGDITLKAKWGYTVTFKADDTETINNQYVVVAANGTVSADEVMTPKKTNYTFVKWIIDGTSSEFEVGKTPVTKDLTVKAEWTASKHTCVVNYADSDYANTVWGMTGDELCFADWEITTELIKKTAETEDNFLGWYYNGKEYLMSNSTEWNSTVLIPEGDYFAVTAIWKAGAEYKTVTFKDSYKTVLTVYVENAKSILPPSDWTLTDSEGKIAVWKKKNETSAYDFDNAINEDITLVADWADKCTVTFTVDGDTYFVDEVGKDGIERLSFDKPTREGYDFKGWQKDGKDFNNKTDFIDGDITLTAKMEKKKYNVIFYSVDGSEAGAKASIENIEHGAVISASSAPSVTTPEGWKFDGWYYAGIGKTIEDGKLTPQKFEFDKTVITEDTLIIGKWSYQVTFDATGAVEGTAVDSQWVVDGDTVQKPVDPTSSFTGDYLIKTFAYWSLTKNGEEYDFSTPVTGPITLYAVWRDLKVGDRGPSGGYIFYDRGEQPYGEWRYYEAAPVNLISRYTSAENLSGVPSTSVEVGQGFTNTYNLLTTTLSTEYPAAIACINYTVTNNGKPCAGWLLPSMKELMLMCSELAAKNLGSWPLDGQYLSSTAIPGSSRMVYGVNFTYRSTATLLCYCNYYVRPMKEYPNSLDYELEELLKLKNNQ